MPKGVAAPPSAPLPLPEVATTEVAATASGFSPLLWPAAGLLAMLAGAAVTYVLWPRSPEPAPPIAQNTAAPAIPGDKPADETVASDKPADSDPNAVDHATTANSTEKSAEGTASAESAQTPPSADQLQAVEVAKPIADAPANQVEPATKTPADEPKTQPPAPTSDAAASVAPKATEPASARPDALPVNASASSHVLKFDPLDFDPDHLSLSTRPTAPADTETPAPSTTSIPANATNEAPAAENATDKAPNVDDILPSPAANQAVNVRRGPATAEGNAPDTAQHLSLSVKSLQLNELPLARFVETLSNMASAPIVLDPITLELNGQSPRTTVSVNASDTTLEKILRDTLAGQRLELVDGGGRMGIALANSDERKAVDFDVRDLATGPDAASIAKLVEAYVAPKSWQSAGGKGTIQVQGTTLHIDQSLVVRREVLIFCERLRMARSKPLRSKYPQELLSIESPYIKLAAKLRQPTTFTFLAWTRLADVIHQWQEMTGVTMLVDWSALRDVNLTPTSPIACSTIDRPWTEALDGVLEPLGLAWWAADAQTICITSREALAHVERVEFYAIPPKLREQSADAATLVDSLRKEIARRPNKHGDDSNPQLQLDEPSGRLVVRAAPDAHRYLSERLSGSTK